MLRAWRCFLRGKQVKADVRSFQFDLSNNISLLLGELQSKTYQHGPYQAFSIVDPKPRLIHKALVRDRVVHHLIYQALYWHFDTRFIFDSYSCRNGKGTFKAIDRFNLFARRVSRNHTRTCWVLKCDIKKFFASVDHEVLREILARHITDPNLLWLLGQIIDGFSTDGVGVGKGLPLGNLTSQLLANIYLDEFDRFVKQELRVPYYLRYTDDFVILSDDRNYLKKLLLKLAGFLDRRLKLSLHERKVFIKTYASGVDFLGWVNFLHHRQLRTVTKRRILKGLVGYPKPEIVNSYRSLLSHGNTHDLVALIYP